MPLVLASHTLASRACSPCIIIRAARRRLKTNPIVLEVLEEWWVATDADGSGAIDRPEYIELLKAM